jgi:hypothetical protein
MGSKDRAQPIGHERRETRRERATARIASPLAPFKIPPARDDILIAYCSECALPRDENPEMRARNARAVSHRYLRNMAMAVRNISMRTQYILRALLNQLCIVRQSRPYA